jgi:hypothetical protein
MVSAREWPDVRDELNECPHLEFAQVVCCATCLDAALNRTFAKGIVEGVAERHKDEREPGR